MRFKVREILPTKLYESRSQIVLSNQQEENIIDLCHAIPKLVCEIGLINTYIHQKAINIAINFRQSFEKYAKCHKKLSSNDVFDGNETAEFSKLACFTIIYS